MRTDEEIIERIKAQEPQDWLGFMNIDLIYRLPFELAKPYLKDGVTESDWQPKPRDRDSLIAEMKDYMPFAIEKADSGRGISASRSMAHYASWVWLAGDDLGDLNTYQDYGKSNLSKICRHYGF